MKASYYNLSVPLEDGSFAVFNTLSGTLIHAQSAESKRFIEGDVSALTEEQNLHLRNLGMIVDDDLDERDVYALRRQQAQDNGERSHIFLTLTRACNCHCVYCFQGQHLEKGILTPELARGVRKFVSQMVEANRSQLLQIDFFGGEPLLCRKLLEEECRYYEEYARDKKIGLAYRFYTNGTLLDEKMVEWLSARPIKDLQITLDGPEEIHNSMRPMRNKALNSFRNTIDGLKRLQAKGIPFVIRINFDKTNEPHILKLMDILVDEGLGGTPMSFFPVQNMTEAGCGNHSVCSDEEIKKILPRLWDGAQKRGFVFADIPSSGLLYCSASTVSSAVIDYKGRVFKCALLQEDVRHQIGQVSETDFEGPNSEYYRWMKRTPLSWKECADCILLPMCGGGCGGAGHHKNGTYDAPNCMFTDKNLIEQAIKMRMRGLIATCNKA